MDNYKILLKEKKKILSKIDIFYKKKSREKSQLDNFIKIETKNFTRRESINFSIISGDINPIHKDYKYSIKTNFGKPIMHGIHLFVYALNILSKKKILISKIKVNFLKPVFVENELSFYINFSKNIFYIVQNNIICVKLFFEVDKFNNLSLLSKPYKKCKRLKKPKNLNINKINIDKKIKFKHTCNYKKAKKYFPHIYKNYGTLISSELIDLSYLIGMECPGYYSTFSELTVRIFDKDFKQIYFVNNLDKRFGLINIKLKTNSLDGSLKAFFRPKPIINPTIKELSKNLIKKEFISIKALIIGGSRGLGNLTAKNIVAGGGKVIITYNKSKDEANNILKEIKKYDPRVKIIKFDINKLEDINKIKRYKINQCYYFATPKIFDKQKLKFDKLMFKNFYNYYVKGFKKIFSCLNSRFPDCYFFIPSTISINDPKEEIFEYTLAKLDTEIYVSKLSNKLRSKILIERYPRLLTDQTNTILQNKNINSNFIILNTIKKLKSYA